VSSTKTTVPLVEGEDFYWEGAAMVFTARFHTRRGYCCESGCRHCPYREQAMDTVINESDNRRAPSVKVRNVR